MKLYFSPLACSLATRITSYEAGIPMEFVEVDPKTADYRAINPLGLVPALRLDDGSLLTENAAILMHLAGGAPEPRLHQWLSFIGTELHKAVFVPLLDKHAPLAVKEYALAKAETRLAYLAAHLESRNYLLEHFTVADAYLVTVLNWAQVTPVDLARWPALPTYLNRLRSRASVKRAIAEELPLYARSVHPAPADVVAPATTPAPPAS
jgi:glutathione S-transferase